MNLDKTFDIFASDLASWIFIHMHTKNSHSLFEIEGVHDAQDDYSVYVISNPNLKKTFDTQNKDSHILKELDIGGRIIRYYY